MNKQNFKTFNKESDDEETKLPSEVESSKSKIVKHNKHFNEEDSLMSDDSSNLLPTTQEGGHNDLEIIWDWNSPKNSTSSSLIKRSQIRNKKLFHSPDLNFRKKFFRKEEFTESINSASLREQLEELNQKLLNNHSENGDKTSVNETNLLNDDSLQDILACNTNFEIDSLIENDDLFEINNSSIKNTSCDSERNLEDESLINNSHILNDKFDFNKKKPQLDNNKNNLNNKLLLTNNLNSTQIKQDTPPLNRLEKKYKSVQNFDIKNNLNTSKLCTQEEIERKRREALAKRTKKLEELTLSQRVIESNKHLISRTKSFNVEINSAIQNEKQNFNKIFNGKLKEQINNFIQPVTKTPSVMFQSINNSSIQVKPIETTLTNGIHQQPTKKEDEQQNKFSFKTNSCFNGVNSVNNQQNYIRVNPVQQNGSHNGGCNKNELVNKSNDVMINNAQSPNRLNRKYKSFDDGSLKKYTPSEIEKKRLEALAKREKKLQIVQQTKPNISSNVILVSRNFEKRNHSFDSSEERLVISQELSQEIERKRKEALERLEMKRKHDEIQRKKMEALQKLAEKRKL